MENNNSPNTSSAPAPQATGSVPFPSFSALFNETWEIFKKQFWLIFGFALVMGLLAGFFGMLFAFLFVVGAAISKIAWLAFLGFAAAFLVGLFVGCAITAGEVYILKNRANNPQFSDAFQFGFKTAPKMIGPGILVGLICFGGSLLFIIPGIIWGLMFSLTLFIVADQQISGTNALKKSAQYMDGGKASCFVRVFLLNLIVFGLSIFVGTLNAIPVLGSIAASFIQAALGVFTVIFGYVIYEHIKSIKESGKKFTPTNDIMWAILICVVQVLFVIIIVAVLGFAAIVGALALSKTESTTAKQNVAQLFLKANVYNLVNDESNYKGFNCGVDETTKKICQAVKDKIQKDVIINVSEDGKNICIEADNYCMDDTGVKGGGVCEGVQCKAQPKSPESYGANLKEYVEGLVK